MALPIEFTLSDAPVPPISATLGLSSPSLDEPKIRQLPPCTMGFDCGFDIYPWLEATAENKDSYQRFLDEITRTYGDVYDNRHGGRMAKF